MTHLADEPLPISLVAHTVFCPRRAWLEANAESADSPAITSGVIAHERVDAARSGRAATAVALTHETLGIVGRCDVVKESDDGLTIVEYKATRVGDVPN